jgi:hypothetical protein
MQCDVCSPINFVTIDLSLQTINTIQQRTKVENMGTPLKYILHSHSVSDCHIFSMPVQARDYQTVTTEDAFIIRFSRPFPAFRMNEKRFKDSSVQCEVYKIAKIKNSTRHSVLQHVLGYFI